MENIIVHRRNDGKRTHAYYRDETVKKVVKVDFYAEPEKASWRLGEKINRVFIVNLTGTDILYLSGVPEGIKLNEGKNVICFCSEEGQLLMRLPRINIWLNNILGKYLARIDTLCSSTVDYFALIHKTDSIKFRHRIDVPAEFWNKVKVKLLYNRGFCVMENFRLSDTCNCNREFMNYEISNDAEASKTNLRLRVSVLNQNIR